MSARPFLPLVLSLLGATGCVGGDSNGPGGGSTDAGSSSGGGSLDAGTVPTSDGSGVVGAGGDSGQSAGGDATVACASGTLCSDGKCHDLSSDDANCGACGQACPAGQACSAGACSATCGGGLLLCAGQCVDPSTSAAHCGASGDCTGSHAGSVCATGEPCVGGQCATLCGSSSGASIQICAGVCTDTDFDPNNCGACGKVCASTNAANTTCGGGKCGVLCAQGFGDCDGDPSNGCEENLLTSTANCGACGQACSLGPCAGGLCAADPEWSNGPLGSDFPDPSAYVIEHGGALTGADGGAIDAGLGAIADAAIDPSANGASVDASTCAIDDAGVFKVDESPCAEGGACDDVVYDRSTGLLWQRFGTASSSSLAEAQCYCQGLRLAGLSGWRLPTRLELVTLVDLSRSKPAMNAGAFPTVPPGKTSAYYLTASVSKSITRAPYVYAIDSLEGDLWEWGAGGGTGINAVDLIRCVR